MAQLRQAPSGPPIVGENVGDILVWDGTGWEPGANPSTLVQGASEVPDQAVPTPTPGTLTLAAPLTLPALAAGRRYLVQAVLSVSWTGSNDFRAEFLMDTGGGAVSFWNQGTFGIDHGETNLTLPYAMQAQTPAGPQPGPIVFGILALSSAPGADVFGHVHAQLL